MKRVWLNPFLYVAHHGARYLFPLVVTPYLAHAFGPTHFADFVIWNSCVWTASLFMEYGFYLHAVREIAVADSNVQTQRILTTIVSSKLSLLPVALLIYAALVTLSGIAAREPTATVAGVVAMASYGASFAWYFQGKERAGTAIFVEALPQVGQFVLVFMLVHGNSDVWVAAVLQTLAALATVSIAAFLISRDGNRWQLSSQNVRSSIRAATPFFVERLCLVLYQTATPLFLSVYSVKEQAAFYSVGDKFLQFLGGLSIPLTYAFLPGLSKRIAADPSNISTSVRVIAAVSVFTAVLALVSAALARFVIELLFRADYTPAIPVAQWFCLAACFVAYNSTLANFLLVPTGRARILILTSVTALFVSLVSQAYFLPTFGAVGAAISRTLTEVAIAAMLSMVSIRVVKANTLTSVRRTSHL